MNASGSGSVLLAGGGTAGHTSPLIATGLELRRLSPGIAVTALGTARGLETSVVPAAGLELELIPPVPMPRSPGKDLVLVGPRLAQAVTATVNLNVEQRLEVFDVLVVNAEQRFQAFGRKLDLLQLMNLSPDWIDDGLWVQETKTLFA